MEHLVLVGSTHGNEWTGAYLLKHLETNKDILASKFFHTHYLFANEKAFENSTRYVERDLNRSFNFADRKQDIHHEEKLARKLRSQISALSNNEEYLLVDMHTTTADMGTTLIVDNLSKFNLQLLSYAAKKIPDMKAFAWIEDTKSGFINEINEKNITIEIGPIERSTLKQESYERTLECVLVIKDFMEEYKLNPSIEEGEEVEIYKYHSKLDYPRSDTKLLKAMLHKDFEKRNFEVLKAESPVFYDLSGKTICYAKDDKLIPVFIGEASYYEKGFACCLTEKINLKI